MKLNFLVNNFFNLNKFYDLAVCVILNYFKNINNTVSNLPLITKK